MSNVHLEELTERHILNESFDFLKNDLDSINGLIKELTEKNGREIKDRLELLKLVRQENFKLIIARDFDKHIQSEQSIVGMASIHWIKLPTKTVAYIDDVVVNKDYRGQKIGKKLTEKLIEIAKMVPAKCIDLTSGPDRVDANEMYKKMGFKQRETNIYRLHL